MDCIYTRVEGTLRRKGKGGERRLQRSYRCRRDEASEQEAKNACIQEGKISQESVSVITNLLAILVYQNGRNYVTLINYDSLRELFSQLSGWNQFAHVPIRSTQLDRCYL